jgi:hypothetical protein
MSEVCWICQSVSTSDNAVDMINREPICEECQSELGEISRYEQEQRWLRLLRSA